MCGEDAVFACEVTQASFTVKWAKEGKAIRTCKKYEISQQEKLMKLTIHNVSAEDSGEYSCEVVGGATTRAKLEIKGKDEMYALYDLSFYICSHSWPTYYLFIYSKLEIKPILLICYLNIQKKKYSQ